MNNGNKPKKSTAMRIVVLALAGIMTLGIIVLPFLQ
jgi:hypothetical protein